MSYRLQVRTHVQWIGLDALLLRSRGIHLSAGPVCINGDRKGYAHEDFGVAQSRRASMFPIYRQSFRIWQLLAKSRLILRVTNASQPSGLSWLTRMMLKA